jgi:hypothetical protein
MRLMSLTLRTSTYNFRTISSTQCESTLSFFGACIFCRGLSKQIISRLALTDSKLDSLVAGIRAIADSADPIGQLQSKTELADQLMLEKISCPIGK